MLFDVYSFFKESTDYNKLVGDDYLFVEFKCPIEEEIFKVWSECHYITFVLSGKKKWCTPEGEWSLDPGQSVFVHKGAHISKQYFEEDFCVLMFFFTDDFIKQFVQNDLNVALPTGVIKNEDPIYNINVTDSLSAVYQSFFAYLARDSKTPQNIVELKFRELLLNIVGDPSNNTLREFILNIAAFDKSPIPKIMEENFYYNLNVEEFARLCGRSLSSFKRDFQQQYDTSPRRWLSDRRLKFAKKLLLSTNKTVQEICYDTGFESNSHFARKFKAAFGVSPVQYRNENLVLEV